MPKLKTKKAFAKRFKITKRGKILHSRPGRRHLLSGKSKRRKRFLRHKGLALGSVRGVVRKALPYDI